MNRFFACLFILMVTAMNQGCESSSASTNSSEERFVVDVASSSIGATSSEARSADISRHHSLTSAGSEPTELSSISLSGSSVEVHGPIQARDENGLTVQDLRFHVHPRTEFLDDDNNPISFEAFTIGDFVEVEGTRLSTDALRVDKVKFDDD